MGTARFVDWIHRKRQGGELSDAEIKQMIEEYVSGQIPDYQMAAMLMAIYFQGMNDRELTTLTLVMRDSGDVVDLSEITGIKVDKHSTGGVGDKTTLIVGPIVAACGVPEEKADAFEEQYTQRFGAGMDVSAANVVDVKQFEVRTPNVVIKVDPAHSDLVETRVINGARYILIRAEEGVEVNGVSVAIQP